jgi:hypothetical protein
MAPELMGMKEACVCVFICIITAAHDRPMHQQAATRKVKKKATLFIVVLAIPSAYIAIFALLPVTLGRESDESIELVLVRWFLRRETAV